MKNTILLLFIFSTLLLRSQTTINANSSVFGKWKKSSSPYYIKGNISVPKDSTLTIESGVQVRFDGKFMLSVYGNIKAMGKAADSIRFYPFDTLNRWRGIRYFGRNQSKDSAIFSYCKFEYTGPKFTNNESCLRLTRGNFKISDCLFTKNTSILSSNSISADSILSLTIDKCYFYKNVNINTNPSITQQITGVVFLSAGTISNCKFVLNATKNPYNSTDEYSVTGGGSGEIISLSDFNAPNTTINILNCEFLNNSCALKGAGIGIGFIKNGKAIIKNCSFKNNYSGRFGCITYMASNTNTKGNRKITIDGCQFFQNISANSSVADGVSCINITNFNSNDSFILRNSVFESNTGRSTISIGAASSQKYYYLFNNIFRGNSIWCLSAETACEITTINNIFHNNFGLNIIENADPTYHLKSINDAYIYNGSNIDTVALASRLMNHYQGIFYLIDASTQITGGGGTFRNCIFWQNRNWKGALTHISIDGGKIYEISNCIIQGNIDTSILWTNAASRPNPIANLIQNNISSNPLFIKSPNAVGFNGLISGLDFHLSNTCASTSPAYNVGLNSAYGSLATINDFDGQARIKCSVVDIGPYELEAKKKFAEISTEPIDKIGCIGTPYTLSATADCGMNIQYYWQKKNSSNVWSTISGANQLNYSSTLPDSGLYRIIVKQPDCLVEDTSRVVKVSQYASPKPNLGNDTTIKKNKTLTLNAGNGASYLWNDGTKNQTLLIDGATTPLGKKQYKVTVTNTFGCIGSDSIFVTIEDNIGLKTLLAEGWKVYPNPAKDYIKIESPNDAKFSWQLFDLYGRIIDEGNATESQTINLNGLPLGTYLIQIKYANVANSIKIIVE